MKVLSRIAVLAWVVGLALALHAVTGHTWDRAKRDYTVLAPPPLVDVDTRALDVLTLGHRGLYDDLIYIWTLQSLVDKRLKDFPAEQVQKALLRVTRHAPRVEAFYMMSCFILAFDFKRPELCERITLDGLRAVPAGWRIPMTQGFIYAFEMKDPKNAAMYYGLAATREGAPPYVNGYAVKLIETNQLSVDDLQTTLRGLIGDDGASRFGDYLRQLQPASPGGRT